MLFEYSNETMICKVQLIIFKSVGKIHQNCCQQPMSYFHQTDKKWYTVV